MYSLFFLMILSPYIIKGVAFTHQYHHISLVSVPLMKTVNFMPNVLGISTIQVVTTNIIAIVCIKNGKLVLVTRVGIWILLL